MSHFSLFGWLKSIKKSPVAGRRQRRGDKRLGSVATWGALPLHLEALEDRTLMAVLPPALVSNPATLGRGIDPQIVIDPTNTQKMVIVAGLGTDTPSPTAVTGLTGRYTHDGGNTWQSFTLPANLTDPAVNPQTNPSQNPTLFSRTTASVAFDKAENFYVVESERNNNDTSGALVLTKFAFGPTTITPIQVANPITGAGTVVLYRWFGQDPAVNPVVAVDNNLTTFTDPQSGFVQTDTLATMIPDPYHAGKLIPKGVYVAWNTNYQSDNPAGFVSRIEAVASGDGGASFTPETKVSNDSLVLPSTSPQIVFTQGTPVDPANPTTPRVVGGQMMFVYSRPIIVNNVIVPTIFINQSQPDFGVAASPVAGAYDAVANRIVSISDAFQGLNGAPDTPNPTIVPVTVNITDPNFSLNDLTVSVSIVHPHDSELRLTLIAPDGTTVPLLLNRVDGLNQVIGNPPAQGLNDVPNLGAVQGLNSVGGTIYTAVDTVFDQQALRSIHLAPGVVPFSAHFQPETGFFGNDLTAYNGLGRAKLNGTWKLEIEDVYNDRTSNPPPQFLLEWGLHMGSYISTTGFGINNNITFNNSIVTTVPISYGAPYPTITPASGPGGIAPQVSVALDNTLGSFSPFQGRLYIAYTNAGASAVSLISSDDGGNFWAAPVQVNDPTGFQVGRPAFMPTVAVDQTTGTVVVTYYDGRYDASLARLANSITTSIDGGKTFSPSTFLNTPKTAIDVATNQSVFIEPVPGNQGATTTTLGFGTVQGLAVAAGRVFPVFSSNQNTAANAAINYASDDLLTATVTIAAGPRIISGDMGAVTADFTTPKGTLAQAITYNNTYTTDHTRQLNGFVVKFDRPVDPTTFTGDDVTLEYRDTVTPVSSSGTFVTGAANFTITPIDLGAVFGPGLLAGNPLATQFLVTLKVPLSGVGTYSYSVGPLINDRIRTPTSSISGGTTATQTFSTAPNAPVPPSGTGGSGNPAQDITTSTINVAGLANQITKVVVNVSIPHSNSGDLIVSLVAPDGTTILLANKEADGFANAYQNTTFDDAANNPIATASIPYTTVNPESALSVLNGMLAAVANGAWTLKVEDTRTLDTGTLNNWSLTISTGTPIVITKPGNLMDQNTNAITAENGPAAGQFDSFSIPRPLNQVPFTANYDQDTLPLIIPGPHVVLTSLPSNPVTFDANSNPAQAQTDNVVLNTTASFIDVTFDRVMDPTTFTPASILRMVGPIGAITGPFTVTSLDGPAGPARTFRIGFPTQTLSGSYAITFSPLAKDVNGNAVDTNLNAGLAVLRGTDPFTSTLVQITAPSGNVNVPLPPTGKVTESDINVTDSFPLQGITVQVNINMPYDPDLAAVLVAPDGTRVKLFTRVGSFGLSGPQNFKNTTLDDNASSPVELSPAPLDGTFNPQESLLNALLNHQVTGKWKLLITNTPSSQGPQNGTLVNWTLKFQKPVPGTGLGETVGDQFTPTFRIFNEDVSGAASHNQWIAVGPASIGQTAVGNTLTPNGVNAGPVTALAMDPSDPSGNTVYIGAGGGGVWKTTNFLTNDPAGPTYLPLTDLGPIHSLNISSIAVFPRNSDPNQSILFVATGEGDTGTTGVGFLRSMDGGKTWVVLDSTNANFDAAGVALPISSGSRNHAFVGKTTFKVIVDPTPQANGLVIVYAAVGGANGGIWRSNDTGNTWKVIQLGDATDVALSAGSKGANGNLQVLFGAIRGTGVYYTTSAPTTTNMSLRSGGGGVTNRFVAGSTTQIPVLNDGSSPGVGRISLAVPALTNNPAQDAIYQGYVYALDNGNGLLMSKDFGLNWTPVHLPTLSPAGFPTNDETQTDYTPLDRTVFGNGNIAMDIVIDPNNPNIVYIGGATDSSPNTNGTGLIRVDTSTMSDPYALVAYDNSNNDGGLVQFATVGDVQLNTPGNRYGILDLTLTPPPPRSAYFNLLRDPDHPFLIPSSYQFSNVQDWTNTGQDVSWLNEDTKALLGEDNSKHSTGHHKAIAFTDPLTGHTRFVFGDDNGVFSGVDNGKGTLVAGIGTMNAPTGSRNGNLQIAQFYYGAAQPSVLAADLAGALFYGMGQDNGFPSSNKDILTTGDLTWNFNLKANGSNPPVTVTHGDGTGVTTDATGGGTAYFYKWPLDGAEPLKSDFFLVQKAGGLEVSKITGLLQGPDNPGQGIGEWPREAQTYGFLVNGNFTVNPIDPTAGVISSTNGTIFRTSGPSSGLLAINQRWFPIANPGDVDSSYAAALAFGAPNPASAGVLDDFIYAGTTNGDVYVTFTGGGVGTPWKLINGTGAGALDGSAIQKIVTDPKHGSHDLYAVTLKGVYFMADSSAASPQWVKITGGLFSASFTRPVFTDVNNSLPALKSYVVGQPDAVLTSLVADWRFAIPDDPANPNGPTHPVLYVGSEDGVYRSIDKGATWNFFPHHLGNGLPTDVPEEGGYLANTRITDLNIVLGNINPSTGLPDQSTGLNLLVASTFGRGDFAIRMDNTDVEQFNLNHISGPAVVSLTNPAPAPSGFTTLNVQFSTAVDPVTFTPAKIRSFTDPAGNPIVASQVVDISVGSPNPHNLYQIQFPRQTAQGFYRISIGPKISDFQGDLMNQNGNAVNGEDPGDVFTARLLFQPNGNSAPVLGNTAPTFPAMNEDDHNNPGTPLGTGVGSFIASLGITDADAGAVKGLAITGVDDTNGTWQYTRDSGTTWTNIPAVSATNALLLEGVGNNSLRFVPTGDFFGTSTFTFRAWDLTSGLSQPYGQDGGTADTTSNGGSTAFSSAQGTATMQVNFVNDAPTFTKGADQTTLESKNPPVTTVTGWATNISAGPANETGQKTHFVVTNDNNALFTPGGQPAIDALGNLTYQVAVLNSGTANVTVKLVDDGGTANGGVDTSAPATFKINVTLVNQPPSFTPGPDVSAPENGGTRPPVQIPNWATNITAGTNQANQTVKFIVTNDNNSLFAVQPAISPTGTLTFQPAVYATGSATVTVFLKNSGGTANGGQDTFGPVTFHINVFIVNQPPSFVPGGDEVVLESRTPTLQTIPSWATSISVGPANEAGQTAQFFVSNDNNGLFSVQPAISPDGTLTFKPGVFAAGTATVTVLLMDNGGTANGGQDTSAPVTFHISVSPVNQLPFFTASDQSAIVYDGLKTIPNWAANISAGPPNESGQALTFMVSNDNPSLFLVQPSVTPDGTLTYQPGAVAGVAHVTVFLKDNGGTANGGKDTFGPQTYVFTVNPAAPNSSADALWVAQVYRDLLKREARPAEVNYWTGVLESDSTRFFVAQAITRTDEFRTVYVQGLFQKYLGIGLDQTGTNYYLTRFKQGATTEDVKAEILMSDAYYKKNGATPYGFLFGVYRDVLGQALDQAGISLWGGKLARGVSRHDVALGIASTQGADIQVVEQAYFQFLTRAIDAGANDWVNSLQGGTRDEDFYANLLASSEYGINSSAHNYNSVPDLKWVNQVFLDALGRGVDDAATGFFVTQIRSGARRGDITQMIVNSDEYRIHYVQGLANTFLGHTLDPFAAHFYVQLLSQGQTAEMVKAEFLQSDEYFNAQSKYGEANYGFLFGVFHDVLGRKLDENSRVIWGSELTQKSRHDVALEILKTADAEGQVVQLGYQQFLGRQADGGDVSFWATAIVGGFRDEQFYAKLFASHEFYTKFSN